jgi:hypothetical protein
MWSADNPRGIVESSFKHLLPVNVWYGLIGDLLIGPFILKRRLTAATYLGFLTDELPLLVEDVSLETRLKMFFQHAGARLHFCQQVTAYFYQRYGNRRIGHAGAMAANISGPNTPSFLVMGSLQRDYLQDENGILCPIMNVAAYIPVHPEMMQRTVESCLNRTRLCI